MRVSRSLIICSSLCLAGALLEPGPALAQSSPAVAKRLSHLSGLMRDSDFRVRTQAAFSLGRLGHSDALEVLLRGLNDPHPAVRAAAAVAIGRLGDPRALPQLRQHRDRSDAVRRQVDRAISLLEANTNQVASANSSVPTSVDWHKAHHYLELSEVANVSKTKRPGLEDLLRSLAWREMRRLNGYVVCQSDNRPAKLTAQLKHRRLPGYVITVSLGRLVRYMAPNKVRVKAEIMLSVFSFPDQSYRMNVTGEASITLQRSAFKLQQVPVLQEEALSGALQAAFQDLHQLLEKQANKRRRSRPRRRR